MSDHGRPIYLPVHRCHAGAAFQPLARDWFGHPARTPASFSLSLSGSLMTFRFRAGRSAICDRSLTSGDFWEGLWEQDVAELFLMGPDGRYHEFNLAPTGAWWSASFSCYRQREKAVALPSVRTEAGLAEGSWSAALSFDLRDLDILGGDLEQARLSVTAIFAEATEQGPEYLCYGHHSGGEPDFHDVKAFLPARLETYKV